MRRSFFVRFCVVGAGRLTVDFQVLGGVIDFVERNNAVDSERDGRGAGQLGMRGAGGNL